MNYTLLSKKTFQLSNKEINKICRLKDTNWKFGIKSQLRWFKNSVRKKDIHNLLQYNKNIIGYTLLRERKCFISNIQKKYYLFDTLIINKQFRKRHLSNYLMNFNNEIISKGSKTAFLICKSEMIRFYKRFKWIKLNKKKFVIKDHNSNLNGMIFNFKSLKAIEKFNFKFWFLK